MMALGFTGCNKNKGGEPVSEPTERVVSRSELAKYNVGETLSFGAIEQDNEHDTGNEAIEWIVLAKEEDSMLVLSKKNIINMSYREESGEIAWADSDVRSWLNANFIDMAFSAAEQQTIASVKIASKQLSDAVDGKEVTTVDKVFLLSAEEVLEYLPEQADRASSGTPFAEAQIASTCWWLRSFDVSRGAPCVGNDGAIGSDILVDEIQGVRPAMWINIA